MLNMIYHLHKSDKINFCAFMPIEPRPIELKVSISKFIGKVAHTFGFFVFKPRLDLNLLMSM